MQYQEIRLERREAETRTRKGVKGKKDKIFEEVVCRPNSVMLPQMPNQPSAQIAAL